MPCEAREEEERLSGAHDLMGSATKRVCFRQYVAEDASEWQDVQIVRVER